MWLRSRLAGLSEVSSEVEVHRQRDALTKLSTDLRALLSSIRQVNKAYTSHSFPPLLRFVKNNLSFALLPQLSEEGSTMFQFEELRDEIHAAREELLSQRKEAEEQINRILNAENSEEARQLYLIHQVNIADAIEVSSLKGHS